MGELRTHFRPEFLNRVDEIVLFKPLTLAEIERIVDLQIADVRARLAGRRLELKLTESARALIAGEIGDGATITVDAEQDELVVRWQEGEVDETLAEPETVAA
jgi:ATP-dependent Clp protease ATP-binding subunit ClpB